MKSSTTQLLDSAHHPFVVCCAHPATSQRDDPELVRSLIAYLEGES